MGLRRGGMVMEVRDEEGHEELRRTQLENTGSTSHYTVKQYSNLLTK